MDVEDLPRELGKRYEMIGEIPCASCGCTEPQHTSPEWLAARKVCPEYTPIPLQPLDGPHNGGLNQWIWRAQKAEADIADLEKTLYDR